MNAKHLDAPSQPLSPSGRWRSFAASHWVYSRLIPIVVPLWLMTLVALKLLNPGHLAAAAALLFFAFWSDRTRRFGRVLFPFLLYIIVYDSMRWYADYIRAPEVHTRPPYDFDHTLFGIHTAQGVQTPNEWWQQHTYAVLDFVCGLAYTPLFFVGETVAVLFYYFFTNRMRWAERFVWVFVWANFIGFTLYYWYPAAPPWYVAAHGFGIDLSVRANAAGALRFDKLVGMPLMEGFYGQSADVFGAIPSLHICYPFIVVIFTWRLPRMRVVATAFWLLMCFSAVYLNHHYLLDILVGMSIALLAVWAGRALYGPAEWEKTSAAA